MTIRICSVIHQHRACGPGLRAAVFLDHQGCPISTEEFIEMVTSDPKDIGVSFLGCDPVYEYQELTPIIETLKSKNLEVFIYTHCSPAELELKLYKKLFFSRFLRAVDLFICNPYDSELEDNESPYRASTNQQLIIAEEQEDDPASVVLHDVTEQYHSKYAP